MEKIKLQTSATYKWGQVNILPGVGEIQIDSEGFIEIDTMGQAEEIASCIEDFEIVNEILDPTDNLVQIKTFDDDEQEDDPDFPVEELAMNIEKHTIEEEVTETTLPSLETPADIVAKKKQAAKNLIASKQTTTK